MRVCVGVNLCIELGPYFAYICILFIAFRVKKHLEVDTFMFSFVFVREKEFKEEWRMFKAKRRRNGENEAE